MDSHRTDPETVTLLLHDADGDTWRLNLPIDCLQFVGHYRRVEGFDVDAVIAFDGVRREG